MSRALRRPNSRLRHLVALVALAAVTRRGFSANGSVRLWIKRLLMSATEALDRSVGWDKLPPPIALGLLQGLCMRLRVRNLSYPSPLKATIPGMSSRAFPPLQTTADETGTDARSKRHLAMRTPDGTYNDLGDPAMGAAQTRFGRNVPVGDTFPEAEPAILEPNPRIVSQELLARDTFKPATTLNLLAAALALPDGPLGTRFPYRDLILFTAFSVVLVTLVLQGMTVRPLMRALDLHDDGSVERIHQEDFCQATGTLPDRKYEEDGGPSLRRIAEILQAVATPDSLALLLRATTMNVLIANGDAHGKNFSLLHEPSGVLRLAPLYDLVSTLIYDDDRLAMYIDNVHRTNRVTTNRIVNEAARWGISRGIASDIISDLLDRVPQAAEAAREETDDLKIDVPATVDAQLARLQNSLHIKATRSPI